MYMYTPGNFMQVKFFYVRDTCRVADALKMLNRVTCMYFEHSPFFLGVAAAGERSYDC